MQQATHTSCSCCDGMSVHKVITGTIFVQYVNYSKVVACAGIVHVCWKDVRAELAAVVTA